METRFYAKEVPQTPIHLSNGRKLRFDTVDGQTGYTLVSDVYVVAQLESLITEGKGGLRASTEAEYNEFLKKKSNGQTPPPQRREEILPPKPRDVVGSQRAAATNQPQTIPVSESPSLTSGEPFKPKVVKRRGRPKKAQ